MDSGLGITDSNFVFKGEPSVIIEEVRKTIFDLLRSDKNLFSVKKVMEGDFIDIDLLHSSVVAYFAEKLIKLVIHQVEGSLHFELRFIDDERLARDLLIRAGIYDEHFVGRNSYNDIMVMVSSNEEGDVVDKVLNGKLRYDCAYRDEYHECDCGVIAHSNQTIEVGDENVCTSCLILDDLLQQQVDDTQKPFVSALLMDADYLKSHHFVILQEDIYLHGLREGFETQEAEEVIRKASYEFLGMELLLQINYHSDPYQPSAILWGRVV